MTDVERLVPFASECLHPQDSGHTEIGAMYSAYRVWCRLHQAEPLAPDAFADAFAELCQRVGITIQPRRGLVYVLRTQVAWDVLTPAVGMPVDEEAAPGENSAQAPTTLSP